MYTTKLTLWGYHFWISLHLARAITVPGKGRYILHKSASIWIGVALCSLRWVDQLFHEGNIRVTKGEGLPYLHKHLAKIHSAKKIKSSDRTPKFCHFFFLFLFFYQLAVHFVLSASVPCFSGCLLAGYGSRLISHVTKIIDWNWILGISKDCLCLLCSQYYTTHCTAYHSTV